MTSYCQGAERSKVPSIFQCEQAERNDYQQDCLLVNMPSKKERGIAAKSDGSNECLPGWLEEKLYQTELLNISTDLERYGCKLTVWKIKVNAKVVFGDMSGSTANEESPTSPRVTLLRAAWSIGSLNFGATEKVSSQSRNLGRVGIYCREVLYP